jgi:hypothetical protein
MANGAFADAQNAFRDYLQDRAKRREPAELLENGGFVGRNFCWTRACRRSGR